MEAQTQRCAYVDGLSAAIACARSNEEGRGLARAQELMREIVQSIQASPASDEESVRGLLEDWGFLNRGFGNNLLVITTIY